MRLVFRRIFSLEPIVHDGVAVENYCSTVNVEFVHDWWPGIRITLVFDYDVYYHNRIKFLFYYSYILVCVGNSHTSLYL